mmetsp:Transcript_6770/g.11297  ORF Transcript_6770/g.11297 Transcript_6770/m.11297 type:complete len:233 (-) Transcript_6770:35-733(-)
MLVQGKAHRGGRSSLMLAFFVLLLVGNVVAGFSTCQSTRLACQQRHHPSRPSPSFRQSPVCIDAHKNKNIWQLGLSSKDDSSSSEGSEEYKNKELFMVGDGIPDSLPTTTNSASSSLPSFTPIEVPIDGSLVVLLPAAVIAIFGIITSALVFASSGDPILAPQGTEVSIVDHSNNNLDESNQCRGLGCGRSQDSDLNSMRDFMGRFAKDQPQRDGDAPAMAAPSSSTSSVEI